MCKSALYASNTGIQSVVAGEEISFGGIVRRFGQNLALSGGNVVANGSGYYDIVVNATFETDATGETTLALYKDGVQVTGAVATVAGTATIPYSITIPAIVRLKCCCDSVFTVRSTEDITLTNTAITVKKI